MKNKILFISIYVLAFAVTVFNLVFSFKNYLFPNINDLPKGALVSETASPSGEKIVSVYLVKNGFGTAIRGTLYSKGKKEKTVFWQTGIDAVNITWQGEEVIYFDNIPIDGNGATPYDCRKGTSLFTDGALANTGINHE